MDFGGNVGIGIGNGLQLSSVEVPERFGVAFKCKHGSFTSEGVDLRHKDLYNKFKEGDKVNISYKEIYRVTYKDKNNDGKKEVVERALIKLDFLDATPTP